MSEHDAAPDRMAITRARFADAIARGTPGVDSPRCGYRRTRARSRAPTLCEGRPAPLVRGGDGRRQYATCLRGADPEIRQEASAPPRPAVRVPHRPSGGSRPWTNGSRTASEHSRSMRLPASRLTQCHSTPRGATSDTECSPISRMRRAQTSNAPLEPLRFAGRLSSRPTHTTATRSAP